MTTTVTSKGQVTIPKRIRDYLGIDGGTPVSFDVMPDGRVVLTNADGAPRRGRFDHLRGIADAGLTTDEMMAMTRGDDR